MIGFLDPLCVTEIDDQIFAIADHPLRYQSDLVKEVITVPVGFYTDFYSVPLWMPSLYVIIAALCDKRPAALHDWLYYAGVTTRQMADAILEEAMKSCGVSEWKCKITYWGLRMGGQFAWNEHRKNHDEDKATKYAVPPVITPKV